MGRLQGTRARVLLTLAFVVAVPLAAVMASRLTMVSGAPGLSLTVALVLAYLLSVGARGAPVVWVAFVVHGVVVAGDDLTVGLAVVAAVQAAVAVGAGRALEARFAHHGPVRSPLVMIDFGLIGGAALPLLVAAAAVLLGPLVGAEPWPGGVLEPALADGIGVLGVTAGLRMLVMGERVQLDRPSVVATLTAAVVTVVAVLTALRLADVDAVASSQVLVLPVLLVALMVGTIAYTIAAALTVSVAAIPLALFAGTEPLPITSATQLVWWVVALAGLLLATDGDRRRAAEDEFRAFFMRSATPSLSVNATNRRITRANHALAELLEVPVADLVGRKVSSLVEGATDARTGLQAVLRREQPEYVGELEFEVVPGQFRWVRCVAEYVPLRGPQHDVVQVQFLDLTPERERGDALQRSNQALERFGRRVTHDLKQPLSAVAAYASTLAAHADDMERDVVRTMYDRLEAVAQRAVTQLDETFRSSMRSEAGPDLVELSDVIDSVVGVTDIDLSEAAGTVERSLAVERLRADPSMLRQVLLNLVTNSLKYADEGTAPCVRIASRRRGAGVEITVTDNGPGVPVEELEAVFERGTRLSPERADGRGHGLADSRELTEDAGGWLRAEPWPDGARFVLWLPDAGLTAADHVTSVLLVDGARDSMSLMRRRLELQPSITVVGTATTLEGAVTAARELRPDVVLLDRWLHEQGGLQGLVQLARAHPDTRIILLTDEPTDDLVQRARAGGVLQAMSRAEATEGLVDVLGGASV